MVEGPHQFDIESIKASLERRQKIGRIAFGLWMGALFFIFILFAWVSTRASKDVSAQLAGAQAEMQDLRQTADSEIQKLRDEFDNKMKELEKDLQVGQRRVARAGKNIDILEEQVKRQEQTVKETVAASLRRQEDTLATLFDVANNLTHRLDILRSETQISQGNIRKSLASVQKLQASIKILDGDQDDVSSKINQIQNTLDETERNYASLRNDVDLTRSNISEQFTRLAEQVSMQVLRQVSIRTFWIKRKGKYNIDDWGWQVTVEDVKRDHVRKLKIFDTKSYPSRLVSTTLPDILRLQQDYEFSYENRKYKLVIEEVHGTPRKGLKRVFPVGAVTPRPHSAHVSIIPEGPASSPK